MKLHIVNPYGSHAMNNLVDPLLAFKPDHWEITTEMDADVYYHVPFHTLAEPKQPAGKHMMLYTHCNPGAEPMVQEAASNADAIVAMSFAGKMELLSLGVTKPIQVIYPPVVGFAPRRRMVAVVGAEQPNGRKRSWLLNELAWRTDLSPFHFVIVGTGWDDAITMLRNAGVSVEHHKELSQEKLANLYASVDLLLCTGFIEGGPLPLLEAMASGTAVLTPKYGLAADLIPSEEKYRDSFYRDIDELIEKLERFVAPIAQRSGMVRQFTPYRYAHEHYHLFQSLLENDPILNRYDHTVRLVNETSATKIMEFGVHEGERSLRMLQAASQHSSNVQYWGFDLFKRMDSGTLRRELSKQPLTVDSVFQILRNTGAQVRLHAGDSSKLGAFRGATPAKMDLIFIDGGHSWETIAADWATAQTYMNDDTVVLFDDYYPDHPKGVGCQELLDHLDSSEWTVRLLEPVEKWPQADGSILTIQMAEVWKTPKTSLPSGTSGGTSNTTVVGSTASGVLSMTTMATRLSFPATNSTFTLTGDSLKLLESD